MNSCTFPLFINSILLQRWIDKDVFGYWIRTWICNCNIKGNNSSINSKKLIGLLLMVGATIPFWGCTFFFLIVNQDWTQLNFMGDHKCKPFIELEPSVVSVLLAWFLWINTACSRPLFYDYVFFVSWNMQKYIFFIFNTVIILTDILKTILICSII